MKNEEEGGGGMGGCLRDFWFVLIVSPGLGAVAFDYPYGIICVPCT